MSRDRYTGSLKEKLDWEFRGSGADQQEAYMRKIEDEKPKPVEPEKTDDDKRFLELGADASHRHLRHYNDMVAIALNRLEERGYREDELDLGVELRIFRGLLAEFRKNGLQLGRLKRGFKRFDAFTQDLERKYSQEL